jgi:hypothetical protein
MFSVIDLTRNELFYAGLPHAEASALANMLQADRPASIIALRPE